MRTILLCLLAMLAACASERRSDDATQAGLLLIDGGTIYLGAPEWRTVEALVIDRKTARVTFAGSRDEARRRAAGARLEHVELDGAVAVPGLQDAHGHLLGLGESLESVDLRGALSLDEVVARVVERARAMPAGSWIVGRGWDQTLWPGQRFPEHAALSAATPDHPVFLERVDGHAAFVNRRALEIAGLADDRDRRIEGGSILRGGDGLPTGVLIDRASELVSMEIPPPSRETIERRLALATRRCSSLGLTCVHDMGLDAPTYRALESRAEADSLRVVAYAWGNDARDESFARDLRRDPGSDDALCLRGMKLMVDGALGSRGAALLEPYGDAPDQSGLAVLDAERLRERLRWCALHGLQPAIHAIGDRGNRLALDELEAAMREHPALRALRPRIEHAQVVAPSDLERFAKLGVIPSMQPTHATSDMRWAEARVGPARIVGAYAWRTLRSASTPLAFGSDFPVESPDPLEGLYAAITRQDRDANPPGGWRPEQRLSAAEALEAFTLGAAFAAGQEDRRGKLEPGYFADLTVLDVDPLRCEPAELLRAKVRKTIVNARVVYDANWKPTEER